MSEVIDLQQRRLDRDIETKPLRAELHIEWRGEAYQLNFRDYENDEADVNWMWEELCIMLEEKGYIVREEQGAAEARQ